MQDEMNPIVLHLPEEFGIYAAAELHRSLKSALDAHQLDHGEGTAIPLRIGARAVETVDASGIQLLIAVCAQLQSVGHRLELVDPSHALRQGIERLAAGSLLNLEPVAHAA